MRFFTIGYGGRKPTEFVAMLQQAGVHTIADVRLRPDRASMGYYSKTKTADKGIEKLLADGGIGYVSFPELGNLFLGMDDWPTRYTRFFGLTAELLTERLRTLGPAFCLLCAEKRLAECHRRTIADYLETVGYTATHLE